MDAKSHFPKLVIVGNGIAGLRLLEELLQRRARFDISVLSGESVPGYNRIMLSPLLAGDLSREDLTLRSQQWYHDHGIALRLNHSVAWVDSHQRQVHCHNGTVFDYDLLVLATGSHPNIPDYPGSELEGVMGFRDLQDVDTLMYTSQWYQHAVVAGGGLLGIEAAVGLAERGMQVTLLHRRAVLMNRQIDAQASQLLQQDLQERGVDVRTETEIRHIKGRRRVQSVALTQGDALRADTVVFATGIRPNCIPVYHGELLVNRGIVVDETLTTSVDGIHALGECIEFNGRTYGLVAPLHEQARVLADHLTGQPACYRDAEHAVKLKVSGLDVHTMGRHQTQPGDEEQVYMDRQTGTYKRLVLRDHKIVGAVLVGDVADSAWYFDLMQHQYNVESIRRQLTIGRRFCDAPPIGSSNNAHTTNHVAA